MSERPVEDEIIAEARNFGRALMSLASQHGRAVSWIEQRRIRKEISRALRQQRQAEYLDRQKQLMWTEQSVDRYRAHAYAVALRSIDPRVDADRRARDQVSLRSHAVDLQARVLNGRSLKPVEQGIALDGIAAATAFPGHDRKGSLFAGVRRVKGINALRYRATVARTREAMPQQLAEVREQRRQLTAAPSAADRPQATVKQGTPQQLETAVQDLRRAQLAQVPAHVADGTYEQVSARTGSWVPSQQRENAETPASAPQPSPDADRLAQVEKQLKDMAEDRDRTESRVLMLQRGLDAVTSDRDDMRSKLDAAEGRISELTNRNQRLAAEIDEVRRDQPDIEQLRAERDRFKTERDEAVSRLTEQTSPRERFGSRERVAAEGRGTEQVPFSELDADIKQALAEEMLTAFENTDSAVIREQRARLGGDQEALNKFAQWWMDKGLAQYRTEQGQPVYREGPNTTAPSAGTPGAERTNGRNGHTGVERSR